MTGNDNTKEMKKMKFICKYKNGNCVTFHVDVQEVNIKGFSGPYKTTTGKSKAICYDSNGYIGTWLWNDIDRLTIKQDVV